MGEVSSLDLIELPSMRAIKLMRAIVNESPGNFHELSIDDSSYRLNFDFSKKNKIHHHS
jgi:hypothetical protein